MKLALRAAHIVTGKQRLLFLSGSSEQYIQ